MATRFQDYYKTLEVQRGATQEEIQRAYRTLAREYHPDMNKEPGAEQRFKDVCEAYEVLKDPAKRARYDALGSNWREGQEFRPPPGWRGSGGSRGAGPMDPNDMGGFSEFFESVFGGTGAGGFDVDEFMRSAGASGHGGGGGGGAGNARKKPPRPRTGTDHEAAVTVTLGEAVRGGMRQINLQTDDGEPSHSYDVKIPPGITHGSVIRLSGQGGAGKHGGSAGNLLLKIDIAPDPRFRIENGHDLVATVPMTPAEAALGAKVEVPTVDGVVVVTLPAGSQSGQRLRVRGHGLSKRSGDRGDLFAELKIVVPHTLSDEERAAYEELGRVTKGNPREG